jgi:two-component system cell cycle sensor histidine kinase/response regulator CckA
MGDRKMSDAAQTNKKRTILIIEDDEPLRVMLAQVLSAAGYRTFSAQDAGEASEIWERESASIDLLITDILMPGLSGPELVRHFHASRPDLRVVVISGSTEAVVLDIVELADAKVFLAKPFNHTALLTAVSQALA